MKRTLAIFLVTFGCFWTITNSLRIRRNVTNEVTTEFTLQPVNAKHRTCKTRNGLDGVCVPEHICTKDQVIITEPNITDDDLRIGDCPGMFDWCCVFPNTTTNTPKPDRTQDPPLGCKTGQKNSCPWCVGLYKDSVRTKSTVLFCGGSVIGSGVVLTAASCVLSARSEDVWVQLPGSNKRYTVRQSVKHPQFNSGTREHDVALIMLNENISWPDDPQEDQGACLGLRTPLSGECVAIGLDKKDPLGKVLFTPVSVTAGSCSIHGSTYDAACGRTNEVCSVAPGSPVLCPSDVDGLVVAGIVRQTCIKDSTVLGSLVQSADWLREELTKNTIAEQRYTIIR